VRIRKSKSCVVAKISGNNTDELKKIREASTSGLTGMACLGPATR
jgi:hypothetical protein